MVRARAEHRKNTEGRHRSPPSDQQGSDSVHNLPRNKDINRWAGQYKLKRIRESKRKGRDRAYLTLRPGYLDEYAEEEYDDDVGEEQENYFEEFDVDFDSEEPNDFSPSGTA